MVINAFDMVGYTNFLQHIVIERRQLMIEIPNKDLKKIHGSGVGGGVGSPALPERED